jgi:nickel transport protein
MLTRALIVVFLAWFSLAAPASAHRVNVFAWVDGDLIRVEAKFPGSGPVRNGEVSVKGPDGTILVTGQTDSKGEFAFPVPLKSDLLVTVGAGPGHESSWTVREGELTGAAVASASYGGEAPQQVDGPEPLAKDTGQKEISDAALSEIVRDAVEKALESRLQPVVRMVVEQQTKGPGIREILGGIGYILGLMGLGVFLVYRKKLKELEKK